MRALTWWFRITGVVYLLLGASWAPGISQATLATKIPDFDGPIGGTAYAGYFDWMTGFGIDLFVTGVFLLVASRRPSRAMLLFWLVIVLGLTRGIGLDAYLILAGYPLVSNLVFIAVHAAIIVAGLLVRRAARDRLREADAAFA